MRAPTFRNQSIVTIFGIAFLCFIALLFLSLGSDTPLLIKIQMGYGIFLLGGAFLLFRKEIQPDLLRSPAALCFLLFIGFELFRLAWAVWQIYGRGLQDTLVLPLSRYLSSPLVWCLYAGFFMLSLSRFKNRTEAGNLLWVLAGCGFFLALNAIPALLMTGSAKYARPDGGVGFFYPLFYFHPLIEKYLLGSFANSNHMGDIIAIGFYAGLGLLLYLLQRLRERKTQSLLLLFMMVATTATAVILFFSRGTILSFIFSFVIFLSIFLFRSPSPTERIIAIAALLLIAGFLAYSVDLKEVWKEIQTVKEETQIGKETSFSTNREAAKRAWGVFRLSPVWGVGTGGYRTVSLLFATPGKEGNVTAEYNVMCHYLALLAEEGAGAFFYFLFLAAYGFETLRGFLRVKSQFVFTSALSLSLAVLMILTHALINSLLERFSISMLLYIAMGASLGVLRQDFPTT